MFKKVYPYLLNNYYENVNIAQDKRNFLSEIDKFVNQKQYIKVTLLNWEEKPLKEIQGEISTGAITKDGASAVRRTATLTFSVNNGDYDIENSEMDFAINKKIYIEIGVKNYTDEYPEYPILWFPQGLFFIGSCSVSSSTSSAVTISLSLKDKMCSLNGDVGGVFPSTTILDEVDTQLPDGTYTSERVPIYDIIVEVVHHFGGEDLNNIVIEDVDTRIKQVMQWRGSNPLYLISNGNTEESGEKSYIAQVEKPKEDETEYYVFEMGDDVGYIYSDFTWIGELTAAAGDTCVTILDQIKNVLGNYEYFYDEYGVFHFREIKNYLNTSQGTSLLEEMNKNEYLVETNAGKSVYTFNDDENIISITCNPKYDNIKNDYIVHGARKIEGTDISVDIMYHLAIDSKPYYEETEEYGFFNFLIYRDETTDYKIGCFPQNVDKLPEVGNFNIVYKCKDKFYYWTEDKVYKEITPVQYYERNVNLSQQKPNENYYMPKDWRTFLYVSGLKAKNLGTDQGYYFPELEVKWPSVYDIQEQHFYTETGALVLNITNAQEELEKLTEDNKNKEQIYAEIEKEFNEKKPELEVQVEAAKEKLDNINKEVEDAQNKLNDKNEILTQIEEWESQIEKYEQEIIDLEDELAADPDNESLKDSITELKVIISELNNRITHLLKEENGYFSKQDLLNEIELIQLNLESISANQQTLQEQFNLISKTYESMVKDYTDRLNTLKNTIDEQQDRISDLQQLIEENDTKKKGTSLSDFTNGDYYLDFIDPVTSQLGQFSISNIGRRSDVVNDDDVNCLFQPDILDVIFINVDEVLETAETEQEANDYLAEQRLECMSNGDTFSQVNGTIYNALATGGNKNGAFDKIKYELYLHTNYQETLSITARPVFYLEPNTRITINDKSTNTYGDFVISTISMPLGAGSTMSVSCTQILERF